MKRLDAYQTADGHLHTSHDAAWKHADERYGKLLTQLAHELVRVQKYAEMTVTLEELLPEFQRLIDLRNDRAVEPEEKE